MAQVGEARVERSFGIIDIGRVGKVERHNQRVGPALQHVDDAVFLATPAKPGQQIEVAGDRVGPQVFFFR